MSTYEILACRSVIHVRR